MSWSVNFNAKRRDAVVKVTNDSGLPLLVKAVVIDALRGIRGDDDQLVTVKGHGHQASGRDSEHSSVQLTVEPIVVAYS